MKTRASQGSTLSLVVACTIVIAILGIGFVFLGFIFGGHRESQNASDSGALNVAKQAILQPSVASDQLDSELGKALAPATSYQNAAGATVSSGVNLLTFNRMVAQAILVALNADAEGQGSENARDLFNFLEGDQTNSLGAKLKKLLSDDDAWAERDYNQVEGNVLRMLGTQGAPQYQSSDFKVAYMNQQNGDFKGANVDMSSYVSPTSTFLPIKDYSNSTRATLDSAAFTKQSPSDSTSYLSGYTGITIGSGASAVTFYGVPTNPNMQPHLVSTSKFAQQLSQPNADKVALPPNAFQIGAIATVTQGGNSSQAHVLSVSTIGTPNVGPPFQMQIPGGYLIIDNSDTASFTGDTPNTDNVAADELGTGILVDKATGYFSFGSDANGKGNLIDQWQAYDHDSDPNKFQPDPNADPPYKNIYDRNGAELKDAKAAAMIPYVPHPSPSNPPWILCTDNNSSSGGDPLCEQLATAPANGLCSFDKAYHPNSLNNNGSQQSTSQATAGEMAQCKVIDLYGPTPHGGGPVETYNSSFGPTGMRYYGSGLPSPTNQYPWQGTNGGFGMSPDGPGGFQSHAHRNDHCQVTRDGTVQELFQQIESVNAANRTVTNNASSTSVIAFMKQRMKEIKPSASDTEIQGILDRRLALGSKYYIYLSGGNLTMDTNGPAVKTSRTPDGKEHKITGTYTILEGVANPYYSYGIHDRLFTTWGAGANGTGGTLGRATLDPGSDISATDSASFQPASGAYGLLGVIKFSETSQANGSLSFNNRD
ncbi:MAG: hypothetical protein K2X27_27275 [Candidatus Obscuribacterales bacterium]|nr:hypothetical protein [Candidatus Obscuribacterales bacterium]